MTLSQMLDNALNGMDTDHKASIKTILTTMHTDVTTQMTTYGTKPMETAAFEAMTVGFAQELMAMMKPKA